MHGRNYMRFAGLCRKETELQQRFPGESEPLAAPGQLDGERPRALAALTLREWYVDYR